ncbi:MAG: S-layer homology domain-containing protein [Firmicutes bacterium]|nr:S-layer homology domain-containing protein [Bacillota bacterium]
MPVFADSGFSNFHEINTYSGQFKDVPANAWYAESVASAYRLGLVAGTSATAFNPDGNLKISEVITLACSLHSRYFGKTIPDVSAGQWYQKYVEYALANGIISNTYADYSRSATRAECITILSKSLPAEGFAEINNIESGAIPDVAITVSYAEPVYKFYRAGIMQGYAGGEFRPAKALALT